MEYLKYVLNGFVLSHLDQLYYSVGERPEVSVLFYSGKAPRKLYLKMARDQGPERRVDSGA